MKKNILFLTRIISVLVAMMITVAAMPFTAHAASATDISTNGLNLIKQFEGYSSKAFWDYGQWSIGYGSCCGYNVSAPDTYVTLNNGTKINISKGITEAQATTILKDEASGFVTAVKDFATKYKRSLNQNQFDALVSFCYNMGTGWMTNTNYNIFKYMSTGSYTATQLSETLVDWCHAGGEVLAGLYNRRETEAALMLTSESTPYEVWQVNTSVNFRKSASILSTSYGTIDDNTYVIVTEKTNAGGYTWGKVRYYNGTTSYEGWCAITYATYKYGSLSATVSPATTTVKPTTTTAKPTTTTAKPTTTTAKPTTTTAKPTTTTAKPTTTTAKPTTTTKPIPKDPFADPKMGDANNDNKINALDMLLIKKYIANYGYNLISKEDAATATGNYIIMDYADINGDGRVDAVDVLLIKKHIAGIPVTI